MSRLQSPAALRLQVLIVCLLLGIYSLILLPAPDSADGDTIAAVAASWLRSGSPNMNAISYADSLMPFTRGHMGSTGVDGAVYAKKGVTPSLFLMPLVVLADALPWLTTRATLMLFNTLVTTATAVLLFRFVVSLNYRLRTGLVVALTFGIATLAFAYAKTAFGEPLAGLLLLVVVMLFYGGNTPRRSIAAGIAIGLLVGINTIYAAFVPVIALLHLWRWRSLRSLLWFGVPIAAAIFLLALYNAARFGSPFSSGYHFDEGEGFIVPVTVGLYGLFLSPYRGIFWYSPVLLLALPGWLLLRRTHQWLAWGVLVLVGAQALAFAAWWSWHGGVVWGPRFLIPVIPLMVLALAPLVEAMWTRRLLLAVFVAFFALSTFVVALGAFYDYIPYIERYLNTRYVTSDFSSILAGYRDEVLFDPYISPIIGHLAMLFGGVPPEPGWMRSGDWAYLLLAVGLIAFGIIQLWVPLRRGLRLALVALLAAVVLQIAVYKTSERAAGEAFDAILQPPGTVVAATTVLGDAMLDLEQRVAAITISAPTSPADPRVSSLWNYAKRQGDLLWFVNWFAPADARNWQERELWQSAAFVVERPLLEHRALLFNLAPDPAPQPLHWRFGDVALEAYGVQIHPDGVQVLLRWSASAPLPHLTWFVHLLDGSGNIIAQQDRQPQGGYAPTETWQTGEPVTDRLLFLTDTPPDPETWRLRVGWVDAATGELLPVTDADGNALPEPYVTLNLNAGK